MNNQILPQDLNIFYLLCGHNNAYENLSVFWKISNIFVQQLTYRK